MEQSEARAIASLTNSPGWVALLKVLKARRDDKINSLRKISKESVTTAAFEWRGFSEALDMIEQIPVSFAQSNPSEDIYGRSI